MDENNRVEEFIQREVKAKLECLNSTSEKINLLENNINEKRNQYRSTLSDSTRALNSVADSLGDCITKARPYYDAKRHSKEAKNNIQQATLKYDHAVSLHVAAREMVAVAENGMKINPFNATWVEMLNHANLKFNAAEKEKLKHDAEHKRCALQFKVAEDRVAKLYTELKSFIKKSRPYFEMKKQAQDKLENTSKSISETATKIKALKQTYSNALHNLEDMSNSLHEIKKAEYEKKQLVLLGKRQDGVGAESSPNKDNFEGTVQSEMEIGADYKTVMSDLKKIDSIEFLDNSTEWSASVSRTSVVSTTSQITHVSNSNVVKLWDSDDLILFEPSQPTEFPGNSSNSNEHALNVSKTSGSNFENSKDSGNSNFMLLSNSEASSNKYISKLYDINAKKTTSLITHASGSTLFSSGSNLDGSSPDQENSSFLSLSNPGVSSNTADKLKSCTSRVDETYVSTKKHSSHVSNLDAFVPNKLANANNSSFLQPPKPAILSKNAGSSKQSKSPTSSRKKSKNLDKLIASNDNHNSAIDNVVQTGSTIKNNLKDEKATKTVLSMHHGP